MKTLEETSAESIKFFEVTLILFPSCHKFEHFYYGHDDRRTRQST